MSLVARVERNGAPEDIRMNDEVFVNWGVLTGYGLLDCG
jgi:hypothetical protein